MEFGQRRAGITGGKSEIEARALAPTVAWGA
jgi:hypothetical protein